MPYYTKEEIADVRKIDLLTYLQQNDPQQLIHISGDTWKTREHESLKISNGKWMWWSKGIGGASALDYLIKVNLGSDTDTTGAVAGGLAGIVYGLESEFAKECMEKLRGKELILECL